MMKKAIQLLTAGALAGIMLASVSATATAVDYSKLEPTDIPGALAKLEAKTFTDASGTVLNYRIYKSPAYSADDKTKPAVLFVYLHGSGGSGADNEQQIKDQASIVNYLVSSSAEQLFADVPYMVVAPQCPAGSQWVDSPYAKGSYSIDETPISVNLKAVYELIVNLTENENADKNNVMLNGISMGGYGTWDLALRYPEMFKAIVPICGGGDPTKAENLKGVNIWAFHCDGDKSVPVAGSREMVEALKAKGVDVKYTEFEKASHNAWTPALEEVKDPYMLQWVMESVSYSIDIQAEGEGSAGESKTVIRGESLTVDILPAEGYQTKEIYVDGALLEEVGEKYTFENVTAPHSLKAVFEPMPEKGLTNGEIAAIVATSVAALTCATAAIIVVLKKKK